MMNLLVSPSVGFETIYVHKVELSAMHPITTPLGQDTQWTLYKGNLIVLGLAFLGGISMTVDIDEDRLQFI